MASTEAVDKVETQFDVFRRLGLLPVTQSIKSQHNQNSG